MLCSAAAFGQVNVPPYVPLSNLEAWWAFTGNAIDSSGHGNNGTVYGCTLTTDRFGNANAAYNFDGHSNYIYIAPNASLKLVKSVTIAAWVYSSNYIPDSSGEQAQIFWRGDLTSAHDPDMLYLTSAQIRFRRDIDPTGSITNEVGFNTSIIDVSHWHYVVGTYDLLNDYMQIYYDGVMQTQAYLPGTITYAASSYWNDIGAVDNGDWQFFKGSIDDVGAWERKLEECEISKLYLGLASLIVGQPANVTDTIGGTATFNITDTGATVASYQWQENSGSGYVDLTNTPPYSGVNTKTLVISPLAILDSGNSYRCYRSDTTNTCIDTSDASILTVTTPFDTGTTTTGIAMLNGGLDVALVPNPNNGEFAIKGICAFNSGNDMSLDITDILGQTVYSAKIPIQNRKINQRLFLRNVLSRGVYLLRLNTGTTNKVLRIVISQ